MLQASLFLLVLLALEQLHVQHIPRESKSSFSVLSAVISIFSVITYFAIRPFFMYFHSHLGFYAKCSYFSVGWTAKLFSSNAEPLIFWTIDPFCPNVQQVGRSLSKSMPTLYVQASYCHLYDAHKFCFWFNFSRNRSIKWKKLEIILISKLICLFNYYTLKWWHQKIIYYSSYGVDNRKLTIDISC